MAIAGSVFEVSVDRSISDEGLSRAEMWAVQRMVTEALGDRIPVSVERMGDGISTAVYRLRRAEDVFYLRVLPETGDSFGPEAYVHALLRQRGVRVPEVIYLEDCNEILQRSVMITTEIPGGPLADLPPGEATANILVEAGRELAIINSLPVEGFGWIKRDTGDVERLEAEQPTNRAFLLEDLDLYLSVLGSTVLTAREVSCIHDVIERHHAWLDGDQAWLAHGDFDLTHIYQENGRYTGIIDFGEIRGTGRFYDLGHFRLHDGEQASYEALPSLLAGYQQVEPLPPDHDGQIAFLSLLIGIRFLGRGLRKLSNHELSPHIQSHAQKSIEKDLQLLQRGI